jgi:hypothetical protein
MTDFSDEIPDPFYDEDDEHGDNDEFGPFGDDFNDEQNLFWAAQDADTREEALRKENEGLRTQVEWQQAIIETERAAQVEWAEAFLQIENVARQRKAVGAK